MFSSKPSPTAAAAVSVAAFALLLGGTAHGQANPTFSTAKPDEAAGAPAVEWKAQARGGLIATSGNSQSGTASFGVAASRKQGNNKLTLDGNSAYGRSTI